MSSGIVFCRVESEQPPSFSYRHKIKVLVWSGLGSYHDLQCYTYSIVPTDSVIGI